MFFNEQLTKNAYVARWNVKQKPHARRLVSIVYARKHCILKEVGYHLNSDLFFWSDFEHEIYLLEVIFSRYYTLLFDISSSNLCIYCKLFIKKRYFFIIFVTFGMGGTPWKKVQKRVPKRKAKSNSKNEPFRAEGSIGTLLKKR